MMDFGARHIRKTAELIDEVHRHDPMITHVAYLLSLQSRLFIFPTFSRRD